MKCKHCGAEIPENTSFCIMCGKKLEEKENSVKEKTLGKKKRTKIFLFCFLILFFVGIVGYQSLLLPKIKEEKRKQELYGKATQLYEQEKYKKAMKLFEQLEGYEEADKKYVRSGFACVEQLMEEHELAKATKVLDDMEPHKSSWSANLVERHGSFKTKIDKIIYHDYFEQYEYYYGKKKEIRLMYHDMDGDGYLEACLMREECLKDFFTSKNGTVYPLELNYNSDSFLCEYLVEDKNACIMLEIDGYGNYHESIYQLKETQLELVANKIIYEQIASLEDVMALEPILEQIENATCYADVKNMEALDVQYFLNGTECTKEEYEAFIEKTIGTSTFYVGTENGLKAWTVEKEFGTAMDLSQWSKGYYGEMHNQAKADFLKSISYEEIVDEVDTEYVVY